jgi:hypothetical protein
MSKDSTGDFYSTGAPVTLGDGSAVPEFLLHIDAEHAWLRWSDASLRRDDD